MNGRSRRAVLTALAGGIAVASGCSGLGEQAGEDEPVDETVAPAPGSEQTPAGRDDEQTTAPGIDRAPAWPTSQGPPTNTGLSTTGGPEADATNVFTAALRDGTSLHPRMSINGPVVGESGVYVIDGTDSVDAAPPGTVCYAAAVSREDGSERWQQTLERTGDSDSAFPLGASLSLGPTGIYAVWTGEQRLRVARLSRTDGSEQWRQDLSYTDQFASTPLVRDGRVHVHVGNQVVAFDTDDGSELWRTPERNLQPAVPAVGADTVVLAHARPEKGFEYGLTAFAHKDQSVRWTREDLDIRFPAPVIAGDTVYVAEGDSFGRTGLEAVLKGDSEGRERRAIYALSVSDGTERWRHTYDTDAIHEAMTPGGTSYLTVTDDHVYYALGFPAEGSLVAEDRRNSVEDLVQQVYRGPNVVALDRADGSVVWRTKIGSQAQVFQPMIADSDTLYALYAGVNDADEQTRMYVIDRATGDVRGSFGPVETERPFAVAGGRLYTHHQSSIQAWE